VVGSDVKKHWGSRRKLLKRMMTIREGLSENEHCPGRSKQGKVKTKTGSLVENQKKR